MSSLLNLPESYVFKCTDETSLRTFRHPDNCIIELSNVQYQAQSSDENTIELNGKTIVVLIGIVDSSKRKSKKQKHWGTLTNYDEDVSIKIAYEEKEFYDLINSMENTQNIKSIAIGLDISGKEAKKKITVGMTYYLVDDFKVVRKIK
jgi:hypothetical protein